MNSSGNVRVLNVILGVWLFVSAFLWRHTPAQMNNAWICGALCVIFALIAMSSPPVRYLNTLLAIWLFIGTFALVHDRPGTVWTGVLTSIAIFIVSLLPDRVGALPRTRTA